MTKKITVNFTKKLKIILPLVFN